MVITTPTLSDHTHLHYRDFEHIIRLYPVCNVSVSRRDHRPTANGEHLSGFGFPNVIEDEQGLRVLFSHDSLKQEKEEEEEKEEEKRERVEELDYTLPLPVSNR